MLNNLFQGFLDSLLGRSDDDMPERRTVIRLRSRYKIVCRAGSRECIGAVVDMSLGGMSLELPERYSKGKQVQVKLLTSKQTDKFQVDTILCEVMWCRKSKFLKHYSVGAKYVDTAENMRGSWVKYVLAKELGFTDSFYRQRREKMRVQTDLPVIVCTKNHEKLMVGTTMTLSPGGATLKTDVPINGGTSIIAEIGPHGSNPKLIIRGLVLGHRFETATKNYMHRMKFEDPDPKVQALLSTYLKVLKRETWV